MSQVKRSTRTVLCGKRDEPLTDALSLRSHSLVSQRQVILTPKRLSK